MGWNRQPKTWNLEKLLLEFKRFGRSPDGSFYAT